MGRGGGAGHGRAAREAAAAADAKRRSAVDPEGEPRRSAGGLGARLGSAAWVSVPLPGLHRCAWLLRSRPEAALGGLPGVRGILGGRPRGALGRQSVCAAARGLKFPCPAAPEGEVGVGPQPLAF